MYRVFRRNTPHRTDRQQSVARKRRIGIVTWSMATSANCRLVAHLPRTAFKKGESGNPRGRLRGTRNKVTLEAREIATRLVDDLAYRDRLRRRMIDGTAGAMEPLMWFYAKGKPTERVETGHAGAFEACSDADIKARLRKALDDLS